VDWHSYYIGLANYVSLKSKDRSTKVGAVFVSENNSVLTVGYNGFPRGVDDDVECRHTRPQKYSYTEHAERNGIYNAAREGIKLYGSILYMQWRPLPCVDCTRAVIQAGVKQIIGTPVDFPGFSKKWIEQYQEASCMLNEARVGLYEYHEDTGTSHTTKGFL